MGSLRDDNDTADVSDGRGVTAFTLPTDEGRWGEDVDDMWTTNDREEGVHADLNENDDGKKNRLMRTEGKPTWDSRNR